MHASQDASPTSPHSSGEETMSLYLTSSHINNVLKQAVQVL